MRAPLRPDRSGLRLAKAAARLTDLAGGPLEIAVILGSGLSDAFERRAGLRSMPYDRLPASPHATLAGHPGYALAGLWAGKRVALFGGRVHLYQGFSPNEVTYFVQLAAAADVHTLIVTNTAGGLIPELGTGDMMLIADQINLTGMAPVLEATPQPVVDMVDAYSPRLRELVHTLDGSLREGVFAGVRGPYYETMAEARALRALGADAVGMSTVLETLAARALGIEVLGFSFIANAIAHTTTVSHLEVLAAARAGANRLVELVERTIAAM